jgi:hypothetical protein
MSAMYGLYFITPPSFVHVGSVIITIFVAILVVAGILMIIKDLGYIFLIISI